MIEAGAAPIEPWPRRELRAAAAAVCFLTRLPLGRRLTLDAPDLARAGIAFPLVGAALGALVGGLAQLLAHPLGSWLGAAVALAAGLLATGALHLDALADSADALGAASRERALEIMHDHAVGSYGAAAIALDLVLKTGALAALASHHAALAVATAAGALSRSVPVALASLLPYARAGAGLGLPLTRGGRGRALSAALLGAAIATLVAGSQGALALLAAAGVLALAWAGCRRWLGGVTGDTLGAAVELTELAVLLTCVALAGAG